MLNAYTQYQNTQVISATPEKILVMLYDGAIRFSRIALDMMDKKDMAGKGVYISKALAIVSELMSTLNHEVGGDISRNLEQLYVYLIGEFTEANVSNSTQSLENAINILSILRSAWTEAIEVARKEREVGHQAESFVRAAG
ncbi:flagellar protein FliS [Geotalea uraniireducens]|uniref:Flagellar secretion chaperone FliS n=1 Tax=Geotalea uraniireducens TaxID=351604 RepID=A0ABM8EPP3_9BACT|nr:flagellar export chaperone FliS [Geotalea uraniireducens]BDV44431.1 flagellar protein FliS [Geotalea uraniireducens]